MQDELDLGWLDYGARMYMPEIGRWGVIDKMCELYFHLSGYNYVDNNSINNTDPDGNIIFYGKYKKEAKMAMRFLKQSSTARREINKIRFSLKVVKIDGEIYEEASSKYIPERRIVWNPYHAIVTGEGDLQSPAIGLIHEIRHQAEALRDKSLKRKDSKRNSEVDPETGISRVEEETVEFEQRVVDELNSSDNSGIINGKRKNYQDVIMPRAKVNSPISTYKVEKWDKKTNERIKEEEGRGAKVKREKVGFR
jgi:RHS repeat-associated protein